MYVSIIYKICTKTIQICRKKIIIIKLSNIKCRLLDLKIFLKRLNDRSTSKPTSVDLSIFEGHNIRRR
jgi:hypothetical protein